MFFHCNDIIPSRYSISGMVVTGRHGLPCVHTTLVRPVCARRRRQTDSGVRNMKRNSDCECSACVCVCCVFGKSIGIECSVSMLLARAQKAIGSSGEPKVSVRQERKKSQRKIFVMPRICHGVHRMSKVSCAQSGCVMALTSTYLEVFATAATIHVPERKATEKSALNPIRIEEKVSKKRTAQSE